jgi:hypothetical protein
MSYDFKTPTLAAVSIKPGTSLSGTTAATGDWVDMATTQGPVAGLFQTGSVSGSPSSFTVTCKMQQADDSSGTNAEDIPVQDSALVITADKTAGFVRGQRSRRWVRAHATPAFVSGTSPAMNVAAVVEGTKVHAG